MGVSSSKRKIREEVLMFWSAVASALRFGWLGADNASTDTKFCKIILFPYLMNASAAQEDITGLEQHLQEGAHVSGADGKGRTALHVAAANGNLKTTDLLLQEGADVNATDCEGETALRDAIRCKSLEVVDLLISAGGCLKKPSEELGAEMCCLAFLGDTEQMEAWKRAGVSFNFADAYGRTPLHVAVCTNQPEMVKFCIRNGSDLEQKDSFSNRPLDDAQRLGFQHLVELLNYEADQLQ